MWDVLQLIFFFFWHNWTRCDVDEGHLLHVTFNLIIAPKYDLPITITETLRVILHKLSTILILSYGFHDKFSYNLHKKH